DDHARVVPIRILDGCRVPSPFSGLRFLSPGVYPRAHTWMSEPYHLKVSLAPPQPASAGFPLSALGFTSGHVPLTHGLRTWWTSWRKNAPRPAVGEGLVACG